MAKIKITIDDNNGSVQVISKPSFLELMKKTTTKEGHTPAQTYAVAALNAMRDKSKTASKIKIPEHKATDTTPQKEK